MHSYADNVNIFRIIIHKKDKECQYMHKKRGIKIPLFVYFVLLQQIPLRLQCIEGPVSFGNLKTLVDQGE